MRIKPLGIVLLIAAVILGNVLPATASGNSGNRFMQVVKISQASWNDGSDIVYIAGVDAYDQALDIYGEEAPVLLTLPNKLPEPTQKEILRLGATKAYLAERSSPISKSVETALRKLGLKVERIAIPKPGKKGPPTTSTYGFIFQGPESVKIGEAPRITVTLVTETLGDKGYKKVQCKFLAEGVSFTIGASTFSDVGYWPEKRFDVPADYCADIPVDLSFAGSGIYTITAQLIDTKTGAVLSQGEHVIEVFDDIDEHIRLTKADFSVKQEVQFDPESPALVDGLKITVCKGTDSDPLEFEAEQYLVSGYVVDPDNNPIPDARVILWYGNNGFGELAGEDGYFEIQRPAGTYSLEIKSPGYKPYFQELTIAEPQSAQTLGILSNPLTSDIGKLSVVGTYSLIPEADTPICSVSGMVLDGEGNPVPGVWVSAFCSDTEFQDYMTTGSDGSYSLELPAGEYYFFTSVQGYSGIGTTVKVQADITKDWVVDYLDKELLTISGRVVDADTKQPLEGVGVGAWGTSCGDWILTDEDGEYSMQLPTGDYDFHINVDGYFPLAALNITIVDSNPLDWELQSVGDLYTICGTVTNEKGEAVPGAEISAGGIDFRYGKYTTTNSAGQYTVNLPRADFMFRINAPDHFFEPEVIMVEGDAVLDWTLTSPDALTTVEGIVLTPEGDLAANALIEIQARYSSYWTRAFTNAQGEYSLKLDVGAYICRVTSAEGYILSDDLIVPEGNYYKKDWELTDLGQLVTISGKISSEGKPVSQAFIDAQRLGLDLPAFAETDVHGNYTLELYAGQYEIRVRVDGFFTEIVTVDVAGPQVLDFDLTPLGDLVKFYGLVADLEGNPISGAEIMINGRDFEYWQVLRTGSQGNYTTELPLGMYDIQILADGYYRGESEFLAEQGTERNWFLEPLGELYAFSGSVVDEYGNGIPGVEVWASEQEKHHRDYTFTGLDGSYSMEIPAGNYILSFTSDFASCHISRVVTGDLELNVQLFIPVTVSGIVTDYLDQPLRDVTVVALRYDPDVDDWQYETQDSTDSQGSYSLAVAPNTPYRLFFHRDGFDPKEIDIEVGDTDLPLNVQYTEVQISGQVTDGTNPISGVRVIIWDGDIGYAVWTDVEGWYSYWVEPGIVSITFSHEEYWEQEYHDVVVAPPGITLDCVMEGVGQKYELSGTVTSGSGQALPGIEVIAVHTELEFQRNVITEADGSFSMLLLPGTYYIFTSDPLGEYLDYFHQVEITDAATLEIVLQKQVLITGMVENAEGYAIEGVQVSAYNGEEWFNAFTDESGSFSLGVLPNCIYDIWFFHTDYQEHIIEGLDIGDSSMALPAPIVLSPALSYELSGTVVSDQGHPLPNIGIEVFTWDGYSNYVFSAPDGTFSLSLPPGTYYISTYDSTRRHADFFGMVEIVDRDETVDITLQTLVLISGYVTSAEGPLTYAYVWTMAGEDYYYAVTDETGWFDLGVSPNQTYRLEFSHDDYWVEIVSDVVVQTEDQVIDAVVLTHAGPKHQLTGTVTADQGPLVDVWVYASHTGGIYNKEVVTDSEGCFNMELPNGNYIIYVHQRGYVEYYQEVVIDGGDQFIAIELQAMNSQ